jgi:hypothetical protein
MWNRSSVELSRSLTVLVCGKSLRNKEVFLPESKARLSEVEKELE